MLIRFTIENFLSFKNETTLDMLATEGEQHPSHLVSSNGGKALSVLRVAALYGANASGKSNLVKAIFFAKHLITEGTKSDQTIPVIPFRLDSQCQKKPTQFEFTINHRGNLYNYGVKVNSKYILEEWLFGTPKDRRVEIKYFERVTSGKGEVKVEFGPILSDNNSKQKQFLEFVAKGTRPNQPFLTEAVDRNVKAVKPLMDWFREVLQVILAESKYDMLEVKAHKDRSFTSFLGKFLKTAGTGIETVVTERLPFDFDQLTDIPEVEREKIKSEILKGSNFVITIEDKQFGATLADNGQPVLVGLKTSHRGHDGQAILFDLEEESEGTQRLINLLPTLETSKVSPKVWVIDELDRRLHPLLSRMFLEVFLDSNKDSPKGQMIFTTHDINLLDLGLLRADEIWFIEKDKDGVSHLYSLAEFKMRPGLEIQRGYLHGRFGAIPFIGDISRLGWVESPESNEPS